MTAFLQIASSITTWISLAAFAIAAILVAYRSRLKSREDIIKDAPPDQKVQMAQQEAQKFGVPVDKLNSSQVFDVVNNVIKTRRYYAMLGVVIATLIAITGIIVSIIHSPQDTKLSLGPLTLRPGETRTVDFDAASESQVTVMVTSIQADWSGLESMRAQWMDAGKGNTPEIWFKICGVSENAECHAQGVQRGINGTFERTVKAGHGTVTFFNFRDSPPVSVAANVDVRSQLRLGI